MALNDQIKKIVETIDGKLKEKNGAYEVISVIAERKVFLSTKKLEYIVTYRIDDKTKELKFSEMLKESGSGLSMGGELDNDMSPGFGFKTSSYKTGMGPREESIVEQSKLFGKDYSYKFDFNKIRSQFEKLAKGNGYKFAYQILAVR